MVLGPGPYDDAVRKQWLDELAASRDAHQAARSVGHKSLFRRLLERLRPHRQEPGDGSYDIGDDFGK